MDLRQLRYFLTVANEGKVTSAAKILNMEQPPLSRQLKIMEQELGVTLFDRTGNRLRLTHAGKLLRDKAESLLNQFDETVKEVKELDEGLHGVLSVGCVVSCISLLPPAIQRFKNNHSGVTFKILEGDHFFLNEQMNKHAIELIVARIPFEASLEQDKHAVMRLPSDPFVAVLPKQWHDDLSPSTISMKELARHPFISLKTDLTVGMHENVMKEFRQADVTPHILCECSSVAITIALVAAGIGATVLPKSVMSSFPLNNIRMFDILYADFQSDVGIVWLKDRYLSKSAKRFIDMFSN